MVANLELEQVVKELSRGQKRCGLCAGGSEVVHTILDVCYRSLGLSLRLYLAVEMKRLVW